MKKRVNPHSIFNSFFLDTQQQNNSSTTVENNNKVNINLNQNQKRNVSTNYFDELDELLNVDNWKKNNKNSNVITKSNEVSNINSTIDNLINSLNNNKINKNDIKTNSIFEELNNNIDTFKKEQQKNNILINNNTNSNVDMKFNLSNPNINLKKNDSNDNLNLLYKLNNQKSSIKNLTNLFSTKNNNNVILNINIKNANQFMNNKKHLSNLETESKNRQLLKKTILPPPPTSNINKIQNITSEKKNNIPEDSNSINSQDFLEAFGSEALSENNNNSKNKNETVLDFDSYFALTKKKLIKIFPLSSIVNFPNLNKVQDECFDLLYKKNKNVLITAPTGSGKTLLFEIAIARIIKLNYDIKTNAYINKNFKIIYIAPIKSLCQEKTYEWKIKFNKAPLALNVTEYTSDNEYINIGLLKTSNIILTTPEKFDVLTRKWKDIFNIISNINLILFDEIHLLNEDDRGATLEAIIARIKLLQKMENFKNTNMQNIRIIAVSATIPNIQDIAEFLGIEKLENNKINSCVKIFGEEYRPVKVDKIVLGFKRNSNQNEFTFEKYLDYRTAGIIEKYSEGKPTLIFCQTQKGTMNSAKQLVTDYQKGKLNSMKIDNNTQKILNEISTLLNNKSLSNFIKYGIAFHNAGLSLNDRQIIEDNFKINVIKIICTTSTLSQGVNLPARLVIIKSTNCYRGHNIGYSEYNKMEIDQMCGRAGRPQFDNKGLAIIMTEQNKVQKFEGLSNIKIESHLKNNIVEHINAEIASGIIKDIDTGLIWIKNTFMYVRMKKEPIKFGIKMQFKKSMDIVLDDYLKNIIQSTFKDLYESDLIKYEINKNVFPLKLCQKMSKNYVKFKTMKIINQMLKEQKGRCFTSDQVIQQILEILSKSEEFSKYHSKIEERKSLNELNKEPITEIKFKLKGAIDTGEKKSYLLLQSALCGKILDNWELRRQQNEIRQTSLRILNCIRQFYKDLNDCRGYILTIIFSKSLDKGMWPESKNIFKQLPKIGDKFARCLYRGGYTSFEKLRDEKNPRIIENICGKNPPFGNIIIDAAKTLPIINFNYEIELYKNNTYKLRVEINCIWNKISSYTFMKNEASEFFESYSTFHLICVDSSGNNEIFYKKKLRPSQKSFTVFIYNLKESNFPVKLFFISDKFLGLDKILKINNTKDKTGEIHSLANNNLSNIITEIDNCFSKSKNENNEGKISKNTLKELDKQFEFGENKIDEIIDKKNETKSKSMKKKRKKKKITNGKNSSNNSLIEDSNQMKITNFTTEKKSNGKKKSVKKKNDNNNINTNSTNISINEKNIKNNVECEFDFLNKFDKFDVSSNCCFDLFKNNNKKVDENFKNEINTKDVIKNNDSNENKKTEFNFLDNIENFNSLFKL